MCAIRTKDNNFMKNKKTFSDMFKPFATVDNIDFHYVCKSKRYNIFVLTIHGKKRSYD
jgi:hypothetical protein